MRQMNDGVFPWAFIAMCILTAVICSTAIRIELANSAMGGYLPRPQPPSIEGNDIPWRVGGSHMWELIVRRSIAREQGLELTDEELLALPLTDEQNARLQKRLDWSRANVRLHGLVSTVGLLQYPLVIVNLLACVVLLIGTKTFSRRSAYMFLIGLTCICAALMIYREYWFSLGP